jgi:tetratricopeptide (TPR) repeat protein
MKFALKLSPSIIPDMAHTTFEECDIELAEHSIPANLKMLEALLKSDPENRVILSSLSMGYCGYAMLFVESQNPDRASELYLRARNYGLKALGQTWESIFTSDIEKVRLVVGNSGISDLDALLWTTLSLNSWIILNLDKPSALSQLGISQTFIEKLIELNPDYQYGLPYIMMGVSLSFRPSMLGGDPERARNNFEKALDLSNRKFFLAHYYYARYYATRVQDINLFNSLLDEIIQGDSGGIKDACLINSVIQEKAKELKEKAEELFF